MAESLAGIYQSRRHLLISRLQRIVENGQRQIRRYDVLDSRKGRCRQRTCGAVNPSQKIGRAFTSKGDVYGGVAERVCGDFMPQAAKGAMVTPDASSRLRRLRNIAVESGLSP